MCILRDFVTSSKRCKYYQQTLVVFWDIYQVKKNETRESQMGPSNQTKLQQGISQYLWNGKSNWALVFVVKKTNLTQKKFSKPETNKKARGIKQEMKEIRNPHIPQSTGLNAL